MSTSSSSFQEWGCSCDIEIAFITSSDKKLLHLLSCSMLAGYSVEDKISLGWGYVISRDDEWIGDRRKISVLICQFLSDISRILNKVREDFSEMKFVLRIGVYYSSYTFTFNLLKESIKQMEGAGIEFELSLYPSLAE